MNNLIDISLPLSESLPVWPGSQKFNLNPERRISLGDHCNESSYSGNIHTGTHIDVPWHFLDDGERSESVSLEKTCGPVSVFHLPGIAAISAQHLQDLKIPNGTKRLLFRTDNSVLWQKGVGEFEENFVALTKDAAEWLARSSIVLVGIDYLSIQLFGGCDRTHEALLEAGILILEGLNLSGVDPGQYELICLPLAILGAEGAPARAVLRRYPTPTALA